MEEPTLKACPKCKRTLDISRFRVEWKEVPMFGTVKVVALFCSDCADYSNQQLLDERSVRKYSK
jgi:C4-type Zn-finger protein